MHLENERNIFVELLGFEILVYPYHRELHDIGSGSLEGRIDGHALGGGADIGNVRANGFVVATAAEKGLGEPLRMRGGPHFIEIAGKLIKARKIFIKKRLRFLA